MSTSKFRGLLTDIEDSFGKPFGVAVEDLAGTMTEAFRDVLGSNWEISWEDEGHRGFVVLIFTFKRRFSGMRGQIRYDVRYNIISSEIGSVDVVDRQLRMSRASYYAEILNEIAAAEKALLDLIKEGR